MATGTLSLTDYPASADKILVFESNVSQVGSFTGKIFLLISNNNWLNPSSSTLRPLNGVYPSVTEAIANSGLTLKEIFLPETITTLKHRVHRVAAFAVRMVLMAVTTLTVSLVGVLVNGALTVFYAGRSLRYVCKKSCTPEEDKIYATAVERFKKYGLGTAYDLAYTLVGCVSCLTQFMPLIAPIVFGCLNYWPNLWIENLGDEKIKPGLLKSYVLRSEYGIVDKKGDMLTALSHDDDEVKVNPAQNKAEAFKIYGKFFIFSEEQSIIIRNSINSLYKKYVGKSADLEPRYSNGMSIEEYQKHLMLQIKAYLISYYPIKKRFQELKNERNRHQDLLKSLSLEELEIKYLTTVFPTLTELYFEKSQDEKRKFLKEKLSWKWYECENKILEKKWEEWKPDEEHLRGIQAIEDELKSLSNIRNLWVASLAIRNNSILNTLWILLKYLSNERSPQVEDTHSKIDLVFPKILTMPFIAKETTSIWDEKMNGFKEEFETLPVPHGVPEAYAELRKRVFEDKSPKEFLGFGIDEEVTLKQAQKNYRQLALIAHSHMLDKFPLLVNERKALFELLNEALAIVIKK